MDLPQPSIDLVSNKGDEITEVKQGIPGDPIAELETDKKNEPVNADLKVAAKDEITEMKQRDPTKHIRWQNHENARTVNTEVNQMTEEIVDYARIRPFFMALQEKDWKGVLDFVRKDPQALNTKINVSEETSFFHIIAQNLDAPIWLMEKLTSMVPPESLERLTDQFGQSALFSAGSYGNKKAAEVFVRRNKQLPYLRNRYGYLPIHIGASNGHKEVTQYLLSVTRIPFDEKELAELLEDLIDSDIYGLALDLLKKYPKLAHERHKDRGRILQILAIKPLAFESGSRFGYWKRLIYKCIPVQEPIPCPESEDGDVENLIQRSKKLNNFTHFGYIPQQIFTALGAMPQKLHMMLWNAFKELFPDIKNIGDAKLMHIHALAVVRIMCHEGVSWSGETALEALAEPLMSATKLGICELVTEILKAYFLSYTFRSIDTDHGILHHAILHRQEKIFILIDKLNLFLWDWKGTNKKAKTDNILHLAGKLVISRQVAGAALQMQKELQWFKAVEYYVHPSLQQQRNGNNKTPREVFTEEHKKLVEDGEKWMKETATSCTIVAALIITVVFAAAFTVPGGNDSSKGLPIFLHKPSFIFFVLSDALALFSSTASLLMFLGILTSRYAEEDFLKSLPKKLIIGLITLFFSIACMMVAFGATVYIFLSQPWKWTIIPISLLGCLPVTLFALLQFPLLIEIYSSTYGTSIIQPRK